MFQVILIICVFILIFKIIIPLFTPDDNNYFVGVKYENFEKNKDMNDEKLSNRNF